MILRVVLLLLAQQLAPISGACSSLHGPFCVEVNGQAPPRRVLDDGWAGKTAGESGGGGGGDGGSLKEMNAKLLSALRSLKPRKIIAAFEMHGTYAARSGRVELTAGAWVGKAPDGWITVGLKGVFTRAGKLLLRVTDEQGISMEGCSATTLTRQRGGGAAAGSGEAERRIAGVWLGTYSCHGVPTKLELELKRDGSRDGAADGAGDTVALLGTFSFRAKSQAKLRDLRALLDGEKGFSVALPAATPARRRATRAGCRCAMNWRVGGSKLLRGGVCAAAGTAPTAPGRGGSGEQGEGEEWCVVDEETCAEGAEPAGKDSEGTAWDFCVPHPSGEQVGEEGGRAPGQQQERSSKSRKEKKTARTATKGRAQSASAQKQQGQNKKSGSKAKKPRKPASSSSSSSGGGKKKKVRKPSATTATKKKTTTKKTPTAPPKKKKRKKKPKKKTMVKKKKASRKGAI